MTSFISNFKNKIYKYCDFDRKLAEPRGYSSQKHTNNLLKQNSNYPKFYLVLLLLFACSNSNWIRELPEQKYKSNKDFSGTWKKISNPRSAINSSWHKNFWIQTIHIQENKFELLFESNDSFGKTLKSKKLKTTGEAKFNGNWLLLNSKSLDTKIYEDGKMIDSKLETMDKSLLYFFNSELNLLFPMMHDTAAEEKNFGVLDGVSKPYDENDKNFRYYMKIFSTKEFQPHAYFQESNK